MANAAVERAVDDLIAKGRVQRELRDEYIQHFETNLQNDILRGSDYTNKTKELANERRAQEDRIRQEQQKLQADRARLEQWQNQVQGELSKLDSLPEMSAKLAAYEQALRDYQILDQVSVPTVPKPNNYQPTPVEKVIQGQNAQPSGRYMTMETAGAALRDFALLQSKVSRIMAQHQQLYKEPLDDDLISHFLETGEDPEQFWRIKYGIDAKRQQMQEDSQRARDEQIKQEAREQLMKELALDPARVTGSPLGKPQGGLTPLLETYAQSRATQHSQNATGGTVAPPTAGDFIPPEKRPEMQASRDRVAAASKFFNDHFDVMGNPTSEKGRQLSQLYKD